MNCGAPVGLPEKGSMNMSVPALTPASTCAT